MIGKQWGSFSASFVPKFASVSSMMGGPFMTSSMFQLCTNFLFVIAIDDKVFNVFYHALKKHLLILGAERIVRIFHKTSKITGK